MNGYAVAKRSGVPRSTVYETLSKLVARGAAFEVRDRDGAVGYLPLPARSLVSRLRRELHTSLEALESSLAEVSSPRQNHLIHALEGGDAVLHRTADLIEAASSEIFLSVWPAEADLLRDQLKGATRRGVQLSVLSFGDVGDLPGDTFVHRFSDPDTVLERVGCRLLVAVVDRREAVIAGAVADRTWGLWSDDPVVALVAVEYVRHDIAMQVLVERMGPEEVASFWHTDPVLERLATGHGAPGLLEFVRRAAT